MWIAWPRLIAGCAAQGIMEYICRGYARSTHTHTFTHPCTHAQRTWIQLNLCLISFEAESRMQTIGRAWSSRATLHARFLLRHSDRSFVSRSGFKTNAHQPCITQTVNECIKHAISDANVNRGDRIGGRDTNIYVHNTTQQNALWYWCVVCFVRDQPHVNIRLLHCICRHFIY